MQLTHRIAMHPTPAQADYFARAAGAARFTWNWALAEWNRQYSGGEKPRAMALKKQFNAIKYGAFPWLADLHRDSHAQPFAHLARAWSRYFDDVRAHRPAHAPRFKKKGQCSDSFYVANDKLLVDGATIRLPRIGIVGLRETLRFEGRIMGATVSREVDRWYVALQVDVSDRQAHLGRTAHGIEGVDLGLKARATLSTGEIVAAPGALNAALRRLRIRARCISRKTEAAKAAAGFAPGTRLAPDIRLTLSNNRHKAALCLARLHRRIAHIRADFTHKLTTRLCRENQAVVIEDLHVKGMLANGKLARAISDAGFGRIRIQLAYKALRYGTRLIVADRWFPSSRLCSTCGWKYEALGLKEREWTCGGCGTRHERDHNAALNLQRLATATALPVARPAGDGGAAARLVLAAAGEVTPVRYEGAQPGTSGQEENRAHICIRS